MPKYEVWRAYMEQWDKDNIDPPDMVIDARDPTRAAQEFAESKFSMDDDGAVIVREHGTQNYFEIDLVRTWEIDVFRPTTLEKLCEP